MGRISSNCGRRPSPRSRATLMLTRLCLCAGNWVAVWSSNDQLGGLGADFDILVSTSADDGSSWTAPTALNSYAALDGPGMHDPSPAIATNGQGRWVVVWSSSVTIGGLGSDCDILYARSDNNGPSWSLNQPLNDAASDGGDDGSPVIATDGSGGWVIVWSLPGRPRRLDRHGPRHPGLAVDDVGRLRLDDAPGPAHPERGQRHRR